MIVYISAMKERNEKNEEKKTRMRSILFIWKESNFQSSNSKMTSTDTHDDNIKKKYKEKKTFNCK